MKLSGTNAPNRPLSVREQVAWSRYPDAVYVDDYARAGDDSPACFAVVTLCSRRPRITLYRSAKDAYTAFDMLDPSVGGILGSAGVRGWGGATVSISLLIGPATCRR